MTVLGKIVLTNLIVWIYYRIWGRHNKNVQNFINKKTRKKWAIPLVKWWHRATCCLIWFMILGSIWL